MPYEGMKMWGEVFLELTNIHTGEVEKVHVKNTLMQRFIDYIVGDIGYAHGIGLDTTADIRSYFGRTTGNLIVLAPNDVTLGDNNGHPELIVLGNDATAITNTDADLNSITAGTYKNVYVSREGGTGQNSKDNIYLKISTTYDTAEGNGGIKNIGLYSSKWISRAAAVSGGSTYVFPVANTAWDVLNLCVNNWTGIFNEQYTFQHFDAAPGGVEIAYIYSRATDTVTWYNAVVGDNLVLTFIPHMAGVYSGATGQYLAGVVLPETLIKTVNHTLTVVWLIHFDAQ